MKFLVVFILSILQLVSSQYYSRDYCSRKLCSNGDHMACNKPRVFGPKCPRDARIMPTYRYKDLLVDMHNRYRNLIASGKLKGFNPAARMATMTWDDELAHLAEMRAYTCEFAHDTCYTTDRFRDPAQCLAASFDYGTNLEQHLRDVVPGFFREQQWADQSYIDNFRIDGKFSYIGHFIVLVVERNTKVGCATVEFSEGPWKRMNTVCHYSSIYSLRKPIYESGRPASKCYTGSNPRYPALCSIYENIDPNHNELYS